MMINGFFGGLEKLRLWALAKSGKGLYIAKTCSNDRLKAVDLGDVWKRRANACFKFFSETFLAKGFIIEPK